MKKIYDLVKKLSDEFSCFEVQVVFAQETDKESGESFEVFIILCVIRIYPFNRFYHKSFSLHKTVKNFTLA